MKDQEWRFLDKSAWPRGPWDAEPDKAQWTDAATGLPCLLVRNGAQGEERGSLGNLCGYVGVPEGHPCFAMDYGDCSDISAHGGLTFSGFCTENEPEHGICHIVEPGEPDRVWWLGFDCAHLGDALPNMPLTLRNETYRTAEFVKAECGRLAAQLAAIGNGN